MTTYNLSAAHDETQTFLADNINQAFHTYFSGDDTITKIRDGVWVITREDGIIFLLEEVNDDEDTNITGYDPADGSHQLDAEPDQYAFLDDFPDFG